MPELPEVETVKNSLKNHLLNRTILNIEILYPRMILTPINEFKENLTNAKIINISRKGKFLLSLAIYPSIPPSSHSFI